MMILILLFRKEWRILTSISYINIINHPWEDYELSYPPNLNSTTTDFLQEWD